MTHQEQAEVHDKPTSDVQEHRSSMSTVKTEFSREFKFADEDAEPGKSGGALTRLQSAWSTEALKRPEPHADQVLVETLPATGHDDDQHDDAELLRQSGDDITSDAFKVAVESVIADDPAPLTTASIHAAEVIAMDILNRAMSGEIPAASKCGPDHIRLSSAIVCRVLNSESLHPYPKSTLQAVSVLVEDVMSYAARCGDGYKPDHLWSSEAVQTSCVIVRKVMENAAARQESTEKQQRHQPATETGSREVEREFEVAQHAILENNSQEANTHQAVSDDTTKQPGMKDEALQGTSQITTAADSKEKTKSKGDCQRGPSEPQSTTNPLANETVSESECCYVQGSDFEDSSNHSSTP